MVHSLDIAGRYLNRAERLRGLASGIKEAAIRSDVIKMAKAWEKMALHAVESEALNSPDSSRKTRL
jgi:hypothetical protein